MRLEWLQVPRGDSLAEITGLDQDILTVTVANLPELHSVC